VRGVDLVAVGKALAVGPVAVKEADSEDLTVDPMAVGEATAVQAWR
jgi:hypothetical protein